MSKKDAQAFAALVKKSRELDKEVKRLKDARPIKADKPTRSPHSARRTGNSTRSSGMKSLAKGNFSESNMVCAHPKCRQKGHRIRNCPLMKSLSPEEFQKKHKQYVTEFWAAKKGTQQERGVSAVWQETVGG